MNNKLQFIHDNTPFVYTEEFKKSVEAMLSDFSVGIGEKLTPEQVKALVKIIDEKDEAEMIWGYLTDAIELAESYEEETRRLKDVIRPERKKAYKLMDEIMRGEIDTSNVEFKGISAGGADEEDEGVIGGEVQRNKIEIQ